MISLHKYIKRIFLTFFILLLALQITTSFLNYIILKKTFQDNLLSISSLLNNISEGLNYDIESKITIAKIFFENIEKEIFKNRNKSLSEILKRIKKRYKKIFEIAFVDKKGFIVESTCRKEIGLNLKSFKSFKEIFTKSINTPNNVVINYPILDPGDNQFKIYFLKYLKFKNYYLLLGLKINLINITLKISKKLGKIKNFKYYFYPFFMYKSGNNLKFLTQIYKNERKDNHREIIIKLIKDKKDSLIKKTFFGIELYKIITITHNPLRCIGFHLKLVSFKFKKEFLFFLTINLFITISYILFLFYFDKKINTDLIIPLKRLKRMVVKTDVLPIYKEPLKIMELEQLKESYLQFIENIKLKKFVRNILKFHEEEREKLGKEVHDLIIQDLNYILIKLEDKTLHRILKEKIKQLRKIVIDNDFTLLKISGFNSYIEFLIKSYIKRYPKIKFYRNISQINLKPEISINLIRIIQEILNNAVIHSNCTKITIEITKRYNKLNIFIGDNGKGFDINEVEIKSDHVGLIHIKERVYILNGKIIINSGKEGTQYLIIIPLF